MTNEAKALVEKLREVAKVLYYELLRPTESETVGQAFHLIETQAREIERLREAVGILEDGLQEVGDDYPGSSCQEWCQYQINQARAALATARENSG